LIIGWTAGTSHGPSVAVVLASSAIVVATFGVQTSGMTERRGVETGKGTEGEDRDKQDPNLHLRSPSWIGLKPTLSLALG